MTDKEAILERIDGCMRLIEERDRSLKSMLEEHHKTLYGNGNPGLVKDVDRLVQTDKTRKWLVGTAIAAAFASIAELMRERIFR